MRWADLEMNIKLNRLSLDCESRRRSRWYSLFGIYVGLQLK